MILYVLMWLVLSKFTDSPVPAWDSFITSLSIVATWMLARKIFEHWYLWIIVNFVSAVLFIIKGLYPTVILYIDIRNNVLCRFISVAEDNNRMTGQYTNMKDRHIPRTVIVANGLFPRS